MVNVAKCQVNPGQDHARFLWYFMLEVFLGAARHDEEASMGQPLGQRNRAIFSFETK